MKQPRRFLRRLFLFMLLQCGVLGVMYAQSTVNGVITDENGQPFPGVNVIEKGTGNGVISDFDGNYKISLNGENVTLVFSYIGYTAQEITYTGQSTINATMEPDVQALDEVVVVGYGTQKKSDLTGSISTIKSEDISKQAETRLENALQGRAAGVNVARGQGSPGSASKISIRGAGSIGNTAPLWIIDGVPQDPGNFFNPNDIASVEVLKDAAASAIYGARAAHGVILVTTKRGASEKINVSLNTSTGFRNAINLPNMLNTAQYIDIYTQSRADAGVAPDPAWSNPSALPDTDFADELYRTAIEQRINLSVSGGSEKAQFFVSGAYDKEQGIMIDNQFERFALRVNSDFKIGKMLKIGESLLVSRTQENPTAENGRDLERLYRAAPTIPIRDPSNPLGGWGRVPLYGSGINPVATEFQNHILNRNTRINGNIYAELVPLEGLTLRGSVGFNVNSAHSREFSEAFDAGNISDISRLRHFSGDEESVNTNLVLTYNKAIGDHNFTLLGGMERFVLDGIEFDATAQEFPVEYTESFALASGDVNIAQRNTISDQYRLQSYFGRFDYSFADRYLLQANIRRDGSSRFGSANQFGVFPSLSAGWRVINEKFMENNGIFSNFKLRASWGLLGSDRTADYIFARTYRNFRSTYEFDATGVDGGNKVRGFYLNSLPNNDIKWEEVEQLNIGLDVGFFNNSLNLTADYYIKTTNDMILNVPVPNSSGISPSRGNVPEIPVNAANMENRGFELAADYRFAINDWKFNFSANAAWNKNEILELTGEEDFNILRTGGGPVVNGPIAITEVGQPLGTFFGFETDGVFQSQAEVDLVNSGAADGAYQTNQTAPGDLRYRDISGPDGVPDGEITNDDRTYLGNPWPEMIYGFNAAVEYKGFDLSLFFQGVSGVDLFNANRGYYRSTFAGYNTSEKVFEGWTAQNPSTTHPRVNLNDPNGNFVNSSAYQVEDGSYLKLRNIQIGYALPSTILDRLSLSNLRIFASAQNIWTITGYDGLDPEVSNGNGNNTLQGLDNQSVYPQTSLVSLGLQIGF